MTPWSRSLLSHPLALFVGIAVGVTAPRGFLAAHWDGPRSQSEVQVRSTETRIASKQAREVLISITNADGRLHASDDDFCVLFQNRETQKPTDVEDVSVAFAQQVGKIQEAPINVRLTKDRPGRYCGHVNLGKQYYVPASYYAFVSFTDESQRRKKERLFLTVK